MMQTLDWVTPSFGVPAKKQFNFHSQSRTQDNTTDLYFEGPTLKTPVAFRGKSAKNPKIQDSMQTAKKQASMLMTIPLLLGVSGLSYLAGEDIVPRASESVRQTLDIIG